MVGHIRVVRAAPRAGSPLSLRGPTIATPSRIRIEDDVVITDKGCEVISEGVPRQADEIEALMAG